MKKKATGTPVGIRARGVTKKKRRAEILDGGKGVTLGVRLGGRERTSRPAGAPPPNLQN